MGSTTDVAIVGMALRVPGASTLKEFWCQIAAGSDNITRFDDENGLIGARGMMSDPYAFDASLFGISASEAALTDPQHRVFLECAWEALESAGYGDTSRTGDVGVYAACGMPAYWMQLNQAHLLNDELDQYRAMLGNDKDFLATRVSYKLNLTGPSMSVQSGCSSSLLAVHLAAQALISGECDMTLAGGVSIRLPEQRGYRHDEGGILSGAGVCRPFDRFADGTVPGNGCGVVVLKLLEDALSDGDYVHAVVRASSVNNDGSSKVAFTAPSVDRQADVMSEAYALADIDPASIGYLEAHGTGTALGDSIEAAAVSRVLPGCALGSVKASIGHLDVAAGVVGLIKTTLAVEGGLIPPMPNFVELNPQLGFEDGSIRIPREVENWDSNGLPRRAAVTSLGVGGTNVHVVLEQAPPSLMKVKTETTTVVPLSAASDTSLRAFAGRLQDHLKDSQNDLADIGWTLANGRVALSHRYAVVASDRQGLINALEMIGESSSRDGQCENIVWMFPGSGSQRVGILANLVERFPALAPIVERCCEGFSRDLGRDFSVTLSSGESVNNRPTSVFPSLFIAEVAVAELLRSFGLQPSAVAGHSGGEYAAAYVAGTLSLENAITLVAVRSKLLERIPNGGLLAVAAGLDELGQLPNGVEVATVNGPARVTIGGSGSVLERVARELSERGIASTPVALDAAPHTSWVEPVIAEFRAVLESINFATPRVPYLSALYGSWVTHEIATVSYWVDHLRQPVRWDRVMSSIAQRFDGGTLLEVGPGSVLSQFTRRSLRAPDWDHLQSLRESIEPVTSFLSAIAHLWENGATVDWEKLHAREQVRRIPLPTYCFDHQTYEPSALTRKSEHKDTIERSEQVVDIDSWFSVPSWRRTRAIARNATLVEEVDTTLSIAFGDDRVGELLATSGLQWKVRVNDGDLDSLDVEAYFKLLSDLLRGDAAQTRLRLLYGWTLHRSRLECCEPVVGTDVSFSRIVTLVQALGKLVDCEVDLVILTDGLASINDHESICPWRHLSVGLATVVPQEYENIDVRVIDVRVPEPGEPLAVAGLSEEICSPYRRPVVALRDGFIWERTYASVSLPDALDKKLTVRSGATYVLTGGLGGVASAIAEEIVRSAERCVIVLVSRSGLDLHDGSMQHRAAVVERLHQNGARIEVVKADVADVTSLRSNLLPILKDLPQVAGLIHAAGFEDDDALGSKALSRALDVLKPKVEGCLALREVCDLASMDFVVLCSSINAVLGGFGKADITAANAFLDAFAEHHLRDIPGLVSIAWDTWRDVGMAADTDDVSRTKREALMSKAMSTEEALQVLRRIVRSGLPNVVVSTRPLDVVLRHNDEFIHRRSEANQRRGDMPQFVSRQPLPVNDTHATVASVWSAVLGLESIDPESNFFDLGGDSLLAVQLRARLRDQLGVQVPLRTIFENPTLSSLQRVVRTLDQPSEIAELEALLDEVERSAETGADVS